MKCLSVVNDISTMLLQKQFIVFALFFSSYFGESASCSADETADYIIKCTSLKQLKDAGNHPDWNNLTIINPENKDQVVLPNDAFKNFPNLKTLKINSAVNKIEPSAFRGLNSLEILDLTDNDIKELPDINMLKELKQLFIKNTKISSIPENYFTKMDNLKFIMITDNFISNIGNCAFCNLDSSVIILYNNSLRTFEPERILGATSFINGLNLDQNELTTVQRFGKMPNLVGVNYVNNSITKIESNIFARAPKLMLFDVSFNGVKDIDANIFPEIVRRDEPFFLILHNNEIQCLSSGVRNKFKNLRRLTVNDNPWKCECLQQTASWALNMKAFVGCDYPETCIVSCVDDKNNTNNIKFY